MRSPTTARAARVGVAGLSVALLSAACSFAPPPETPATVADLPADYATPTAAGDYESFEWWTVFDDPVLDGLVQTALEANPDLYEAAGRLEELRNRYRIARSALFPSVTAGADVTRSSSPANTGLGGAIGGDVAGDSTAGLPPGLSFEFPDRFEFTTYSASLGFQYEVDFWGRVRNETGAASADLMASRADFETVRMAVVAATVSTYFEIVSLGRQVRLLEENVDLLAERAELTEARYRSGLTGSFELYSIRQLYRTAQADLPLVRTQLADAEGRLAVLLGRYAGRLADLLPSELAPSIEASPVAPGLPVRLLEGRPDVIAARERLEAARLRIGARRAEQLPTISLNGNVGFQTSEPSELFRVDQWFLNLIGGLTAPIFQGGRIRANIGVAEAQYDQLLAAYVRTVLTAYKEVRNSLLAFDSALERHARTLDRVTEAEASLSTQLQRFQRGVGDYVGYLDARVNLIGARQAHAEVERGLAESRLAVHRSLGGAWVRTGARDEAVDRPRETETEGPSAGSGER